MQEWIDRLVAGETLSAGEAEAVFGAFMDGSATPVQMSGLLTALRLRGETPAEVAGGVRALRTAMRAIDLPADGLVDTCGTGGGSLTTFNISTTAALVAAGGGVRVAKHGNRSYTSRCGSADVLEALGIPVELDPPTLRRMFEEAGFVFLYAPRMHPAMRHVAPVRGELGIRTIFNLLGPLTSPARVRRQVVGVAEPDLLHLVAEALRELGHERALVVHGEPGLDELSPLGPTHTVALEDGELEEREVLPEHFGWGRLDPEGLRGGTPEENARRTEAVLKGEADGAAEAAVVLNAAAAFWVAGLADDLPEGAERARESLRSGAARRTLERLRDAARPA